MRIVLLGYMGSGKTTVGTTLAKVLGIDFVDLDTYIEIEDRQSIAEIFNTKGEIYFRKKEQEYLKQILSSDGDFVLSTGGGTPCYGKNMETILKGTKNVFYLKTALDELINRLSKEKEHRPLIRNIANSDLPEFIGKHLFERSFYYEMAHHSICSGEKNAEMISNEIKDLLV